LQEAKERKKDVAWKEGKYEKRDLKNVALRNGLWIKRKIGK